MYHCHCCAMQVYTALTNVAWHALDVQVLPRRRRRCRRRRGWLFHDAIAWRPSGQQRQRAGVHCRRHGLWTEWQRRQRRHAIATSSHHRRRRQLCDTDVTRHRHTGTGTPVDHSTLMAWLITINVRCTRRRQMSRIVASHQPADHQHGTAAVTLTTKFNVLAVTVRPS